MDACPTCGAELQATASIYLENVTLSEDGAVVSYDVARHLGDDATGVVLDNVRVYCANDHAPGIAPAGRWS